MLEEISAEQYLNWLSYYEISPWGYEIENYRSGIIASAIMNVNRSKKSDKLFTLDDFFPKRNKQIKKQTSDEQLAIAKSYMSLYANRGGK
jgi:hypothetical protein